MTGLKNKPKNAYWTQNKKNTRFRRPKMRAALTHEVRIGEVSEEQGCLNGRGTEGRDEVDLMPLAHGRIETHSPSALVSRSRARERTNLCPPRTLPDP